MSRWIQSFQTIFFSDDYDQTNEMPKMICMNDS